MILPQTLPLAVSVVLHDVSPHTWPACAQLLAALEEVATVPVTLLLVTDYHRRGGVEQYPEFVAMLHARIARGDEVVVHGLVHRDEAPAPRQPLEWLKRRVYTAGEGEFAALGPEEARMRLTEGWQRLTALGLEPQGFVAPAWLMGAGTEAALRQSPFAYTTTRRALILLPEGQRLTAPSLVWSVRSAWRRRLSAWVNGRMLKQVLAHPARYPLLRLGLHPVDAAYPEVVRFWQQALEAALGQGRQALTKGQWAGYAKQGEGFYRR